MTETINKFNESMNEMKELVMRRFGSEVLDMSAEEFKMFQVMFHLIDNSTELVVKQAEMIESLNGKLDKLLATK